MSAVAAPASPVTAVVPTAASSTVGFLPVAWIPERELDLKEWGLIGQRFGVMGRCNQWWIGDWIRYGNARYGEKYSRAAKLTGYDVQTLRNMVWVASQFDDISCRRAELSWGHPEWWLLSNRPSAINGSPAPSTSGGHHRSAERTAGATWRVRQQRSTATRGTAGCQRPAGRWEAVCCPVCGQPVPRSLFTTCPPARHHIAHRTAHPDPRRTPEPSRP